MEYCNTCGMSWESGLFGPSSCPRCEVRERAARDVEVRHEETMRALNRETEAKEEARRAWQELEEARLRADREAQEAAEQRHREQIEEAEAHRRFLEEQEWERQHAEDAREAERQQHAERLEAERKAHQESLAERQRRELYHHSLRQSRFGRARDDLDIALAQRPFDLATAESALRASVAQWPGYAWAWLELAEVLCAQGRPFEQEADRACTSALAEGVWKLAPDGAAPELLTFAQSLGVNPAVIDGVPARQARFMVRFARVAPAGRIARLLDGSAAFYALCRGAPSDLRDPDRDAPFEVLSRIAQVDRIALLYLASCAAEALERFVGYSATIPAVRDAVARGHLLGDLGDDAMMFRWCAALARPKLASDWIRCAIAVRLVEPKRVLDAAFAPTEALALEASQAVGLPLAQRAPALRAVWVQQLGLPDPPRWEERLDQAFELRAHTLQRLSSSLQVSLGDAHASLRAFAGHEPALRATAVTEGRARFAAWQSALGELYVAWKSAQLELIATTPVAGVPIAPPNGAYSDDSFRAWRRRIDAAIMGCDPARAEFGDAEVDQRALAHRLEVARVALASTRPLIAQHINGYEAVERPRIRAMLESASLLSPFGTWFASGILVCAPAVILSSWLDPNTLCAAIMALPVGAAVVGALLREFKRHAAAAEVALDVESEVTAFRARVESIMATPSDSARSVLALMGETAIAPTPPPQEIAERPPRSSGRVWRVALAISVFLLLVAAIKARAGRDTTTEARAFAVSPRSESHENVASSSAPPTSPPSRVAVTPSPSSCVIPQASSFHLRPTQTLEHRGSRRYPEGVEVSVIYGTDLWRDGDQRMYRVRVLRDGAEGYIFLTPRERALCPWLP
jgi:hypothetical protein